MLLQEETQRGERRIGNLRAAPLGHARRVVRAASFGARADAFQRARRVRAERLQRVLAQRGVVPCEGRSAKPYKPGWCSEHAHHRKLRHKTCGIGLLTIAEQSSLALV